MALPAVVLQRFLRGRLEGISKAKEVVCAGAEAGVEEGDGEGLALGVPGADAVLSSPRGDGDGLAVKHWHVVRKTPIQQVLQTEDIYNIYSTECRDMDSNSTDRQA